MTVLLGEEPDLRACVSSTSHQAGPATDGCSVTWRGDGVSAWVEVRIAMPAVSSILAVSVLDTPPKNASGASSGVTIVIDTVWFIS